MIGAALFSKGFLPINPPIAELLVSIAGWAVASIAVSVVARWLARS